jgi:methionyl aminopeptidase
MNKKPRRGGRVTPPSKPRGAGRPGASSGLTLPDSPARPQLPDVRGGLRRLARPAVRQGSVRPGRQSPRRQVPPSILRPPYAESGQPAAAKRQFVQSPEMIERMRVAGAMAAEVLMLVGDEIAPGVTTDHLDAVGHRATVERGAYPSPLNYRRYPKSLCTSVNEVICHGIPDDRPLEDGDIVNVDVTVYFDGVHGDTNATFLVGDVAEDSRKLIRETRAAMFAGIGAVRPGARVYDIGRAIQTHAEGCGLGVVREFIGHGISDEFHGGLQILHYYDRRADTVLEAGMTFTVEPMITLGSPALHMWDDGWTAVTNDASRCAQFEHTLVVTDDGFELLTVTEDGRSAADVVAAQLG